VTPLHFAALDGHGEVAKLLIAKGADVNARDAEGVTPLHRATRAGRRETAEELIAGGAVVNVKSSAGLTPLDMADEQTAGLLRRHGGKTGEKLGALSVDAANGDASAVRQHLAAGTDVNAKDELGRTPLYRTAYNGHREISELLITEGADLDAKDGNGWTPLHGAAYKGHDSIVALLIAGGADLNAKDADGDTPWDWAKNKPETADLLRKHGGKAGSALK
jgi:cytohesin